MGADDELLKAAYETHAVYLKPAFPPPEEKKSTRIIDDANWKDYLGDERCVLKHSIAVGTLSLLELI